MTEAELIEALARRMAHVTHANPRYPDHIYDEDWELYVGAACECLRQMKWTATEVAHDWRCSEGYDDRADAQDIACARNFTLAPPEWKP